MVLFKAASAAALAATAAASLSTYQPRRPSPAEFDWDTLTPSTALHFSSCYDEYECARLVVPLDWTVPGAEQLRSGADRTMTLALTRLRANMTGASGATAAAHGGTLIVNPGGPGDSGTVEMLKNGHYLRDLVATEERRFDVLSFDPRGMGFSTPRADCFEGEEAARALLDAQMLGAAGAGVIGDDRDEVLAAKRALARAHGERCNVAGEEGYVVQEYVGTASVARDMLLMVDELERLRVREEEMGGRAAGDGGAQKTVAGGRKTGKLPRLLYLGTSYGTMLGNTFVSMFPDRVERMILDGNVVPEDYAAGDWSGNIADASKVIDHFYDFCFAAKSACALYDPSDASPGALRAKVDDLAARLTASPLVLAKKGFVPTILKGSTVLDIFADPMYEPITGFAPLASTLADAIAGNYTALIAAAGLEVSQDGIADNATLAEYRWMGQANAAVRCSDGADLRNTTNDEWRAQLAHARTLSPDWADRWMAVDCVEWPVRPNWRYAGPFGTEEAGEGSEGRGPSAPVLFLSSRFDPATPLRSSVQAARAHPGSRVVVQNTVGHCASLSGPGECVKGIVGRYMATGEMPEEGMECEADCRPFEECPYLRAVLPR